MVGVQSLPEKGTQLPLSRIVIHEDFNNLISEDIALLRLRDPVSWSPLVQPVCLPTTKLRLAIGTLCWTIVWGLKNNRGEWRQAQVSRRPPLRKQLHHGLIHSFLHSLVRSIGRHFPSTYPCCTLSEPPSMGRHTQRSSVNGTRGWRGPQFPKLNRKSHPHLAAQQEMNLSLRMGLTACRWPWLGGAEALDGPHTRLLL